MYVCTNCYGDQRKQWPKFREKDVKRGFPKKLHRKQQTGKWLMKGKRDCRGTQTWQDVQSPKKNKPLGENQDSRWVRGSERRHCWDNKPASLQGEKLRSSDVSYSDGERGWGRGGGADNKERRKEEKRRKKSRGCWNLSAALESPGVILVQADLERGAEYHLNSWGSDFFPLVLRQILPKKQQGCWEHHLTG